MLAGYPQIRLVCVSAGGNDFAGGGDLDDKILAPDCSGATTVEQCYRAGEPQGVFDSVETARGDLLAAVAAVRPDLTVLVHNYDYAIPDGRALIGVRSWLKLPMDNARVPTAGAPKDRLRRDIVRDLIDRFTLCLDDVRRCPRSRWSWCGRRERLRTPVGRTSCIASLRASPRSSTTARAAPRVTRSDCPDR